MTPKIEIDKKIETKAQNLFSGTAVVADDAAASFTVPSPGRAIVVIDSDGAGPRGMFFVNTPFPTCTSIALATTSVTTDFTTGALAGTTGTDGRITLSAHSDGKFYIENRCGSQRTFRIQFLCAV